MKTTNPAATDSINNGDGALRIKQRRKPDLGNASSVVVLSSEITRRWSRNRRRRAVGQHPTAEASRGSLSPGDAALLRFPAALELLEADFWIQYNELGGIQDDEVPGGSGNEAYTDALEVIEDEMQDYIHDNTDDEITHHQFLNAYLVSKGAAPANLDPFRTLMGSTATGVNPDKIGKRLTNLTQLTIDTSWWTRYRDDRHNPDLDPNHVFPQAVPTLAVNQHTAIPRTDADTTRSQFSTGDREYCGFPLPNH